MPRKAFTPTEEERARVQAMTAYNIEPETIARLILRPFGRARVLTPISVKTLQRHFGEELKTGKAITTTKVAHALVTTALDVKNPRHVAAAIFYLETMAGWTKKVDVNSTGSMDLNLEGATNEELEIILKFLRRKAGEDERRPANAA